MAFSTDIQEVCRLSDDPNGVSSAIMNSKKKMLRYFKFHIATVLVFVGVATVCLLMLSNVIKGVGWPDENLLAKFTERSQSEPISVTGAGRTVWTKSYDVSFAPAEQVFVVAELYEANKPMRLLDAGILAGSTDAQKLTVVFSRTYKNKAGTVAGHSIKIKLNGLVLEIPEFSVDDRGPRSDRVITWFQGGQLRKDSHRGFTRLFNYHSVDRDTRLSIWIPGLGVSTGIHSRFVLKMIPVSRLNYLAIDPVVGSQGLDGHIMTYEQLSVIGEQYKQSMTARVVKLARDSK